MSESQILLTLSKLIGQGSSPKVALVPSGLRISSTVPILLNSQEVWWGSMGPKSWEGQCQGPLYEAQFADTQDTESEEGEHRLSNLGPIVPAV